MTVLPAVPSVEAGIISSVALPHIEIHESRMRLTEATVTMVHGIGIHHMLLSVYVCGNWWHGGFVMPCVRLEKMRSARGGQPRAPDDTAAMVDLLSQIQVWTAHAGEDGDGIGGGRVSYQLSSEGRQQLLHDCRHVLQPAKHQLSIQYGSHHHQILESLDIFTAVRHVHCSGNGTLTLLSHWKMCC